jgi:hypothetical protein
MAHRRRLRPYYGLDLEVAKPHQRALSSVGSGKSCGFRRPHVGWLGLLRGVFYKNVSRNVCVGKLGR